MRYYLLSVWKKNGKNSYSQCCSTSTEFNDLLYNMTLYIIEEDEMYVISLIENGNENNQGGNVNCTWYYDEKRNEITVDNKVNKIITNAIDNILSQDELEDLEVLEVAKEPMY